MRPGVVVALVLVSLFLLVSGLWRDGSLRPNRLRPSGTRPTAMSDVAGGCAVGCAAYLFRGSLVLAVLAGFTAMMGLGLRRRGRTAQAARALAAQLPEFAASLGAAVRAGRSIPQAIRRAGDDLADPLAVEVKTLVSDLDLGLPLATALEDFAIRIGSPDVRLFATTIMLQQRTGGDLPKTLAALATRLDERDRLGAELRTATAQARMTAWLVGGLPLAGGILVEFASPGSLANTLGTPPGLGVVGAAALLQLAGMLLVRRLLRGIW